VIASRETASRLAGWQGTRGVLRRRLVPDGAAAREALIKDVTWLHGFLARLGDTFTHAEARQAAVSARTAGRSMS
jgi:hypothetical protein